MQRTRHLSTAFALLTLVYPSWVFGGTSRGIQWPMSVLAACGMLVWLGELLIKPYPRRRLSMPAREPVLYAGGAFLLLLLVHWLNAGRSHVFDLTTFQWRLGPPPIAWLPGAIKKAEALEMLVWFGPAVWLALWLRTARSPMRSALLCGVLVNGILLNIFGIAQAICSPDRIYGLILLSVHFYAGFGYSNHAGQYNLLLLCLGLGLAFGQTTCRRRRVGAIAAAAGAIGIHLSLCLASILLMWGFLVLVTLYTWCRRTRDTRSPAYIVHLVAGATGTAVLAAFGLYAVSDQPWFLTVWEPVRATLARDVEARAELVGPAIDIWGDYPLFGSGGWGFRHLLGYYRLDDTVALLGRAGKANVHNDLLQFLAEFGLVGTGLLLTPVVAALRRWPWDLRPPQVFWAAGVLLIAGHSLIDLPFRSPAVLLLWIAALYLTAASPAHKRAD